MGLFSRKKSGQNTRPASRTRASSEAQAAELRGRARRRLIGALALVLLAVIIVPMVFDDPVVSEQAQTPVVLPAAVPPVPDPDLALAPRSSEYAVDQPALSDGTALAEDGGASPDSVGDDGATAPAAADHTADSASAAADQSAATAQADTRAEPESEPAQAPKPSTREPERTDSDQRTDDGSVALALLEGRTPGGATSPSPQPQAQGNFILQVAAYSAETDAQARRKHLADAGVTNAYVEKGVSNDKPTYRLRVGPFPTRDAAQAAQARLRALDYDNSLLLTR